MRLALQRLGAPEQRLPALQIAGTNGKGSTAAFTESILRAAGFRTGLFTSPHLSRFTERIRIAGDEADGDRLGELDRRVLATGVPLTYFEVSTALAFLLMAEERVDVAVLETGLGGRLDSVTTCHPVATAITSIGFDHMDYLGRTLEEIAVEKAGIIKPGVPLYLGTVPKEAEREIARIAAERGAPLSRLGRDFAPLAAERDVLGLLGRHQGDNAAIAVRLATAAADASGRRAALTAEAIARGLRDVRWPGRLEFLGDDLLLDCAHNAEGAAALAAALPTLLPARTGRALVLSVVRGKDLRAIGEALLPLFDVVVATASSNPRALPAAELAAALGALSPAPRLLQAIAEPLAAVDEARRLLGAAGTVVVAGSVFLIGDVRAAVLGAEAVDPRPSSDPV